MGRDELDRSDAADARHRAVAPAARHATSRPVQRRSWPARHKVPTVLIAFIALVVVGSIIIGGTSGSGSRTPQSAGAASATAVAAPPAAASASAFASAFAAPSPSAAPATKVEFIVSGSTPNGIDITYGPSGTNLSGPTTLDGTVKESVPFDSSAEFYALQAQLQSGGDITCKIVVTGPGDKPLTVSHGAASGGYNICSAQATSDDGVSWQNEN